MRKLVVLFMGLLVSCAGVNFNNVKETAIFLDELRESEVTLAAIDPFSGSIRGFCAGVIVDNNKVLTANHCTSVADAGNTIYVLYRNRLTLEVAPCKQDASVDLALLKVVDSDFKSFHPGDIRAVRKSEPELGEEVWTIGTPTGEEKVVTASRLSKHAVMTHMGFVGNLYAGAAYYGNSGGPLFDNYGRIVGILSQAGITRTPTGDWFFAVTAHDIRNFIVHEVKPR